MKSPVNAPVLVAIAMTIVAVSALGYIGVSKYSESRQRQEIQNQQAQAQIDAQKVALEEAQKKIELLNAEIASSTQKTKVSTRATPAPSVTDNSRVIAQLKVFDDYLEYDLVGADVDCSVLLVDNPVLWPSQKDFEEAFPKPRDIYEQKCLSSHVAVITGEKKLVAEPELKALRELLSSYTVLVKEMSTYALDGGSNVSKINSYSPRLKQLRTDSREEVLRLKRKFGVPVE